jgi:CheY-like chemotaxis protein
MDHHIKFLATGKEALDFLSGPQGTLVAKNLVALFLDLKLPGLGGLELLRRLRKKYGRLPVIVMTGSENSEDWEECRRLGVTHYITKPVTFASFAKAVADVYQPSSPEQALATTVFSE